MSTVRMCDGCGLIFKEGAEGTSVGTVTVMVKATNGRTVPEQRSADFCDQCTNGTGVTPRVQAAIERGSKDGQGQALYADVVTDTL